MGWSHHLISSIAILSLYSICLTSIFKVTGFSSHLILKMAPKYYAPPRDGFPITSGGTTAIAKGGANTKRQGCSTTSTGPPIVLCYSLGSPSWKFCLFFVPVNQDFLQGEMWWSHHRQSLYKKDQVWALPEIQFRRKEDWFPWQWWRWQGTRLCSCHKSSHQQHHVGEGHLGRRHHYCHASQGLLHESFSLGKPSPTVWQTPVKECLHVSLPS